MIFAGCHPLCPYDILHPQKWLEKLNEGSFSQFNNVYHELKDWNGQKKLKLHAWVGITGLEVRSMTLLSARSKARTGLNTWIQPSFLGWRMRPNIIKLTKCWGAPPKSRTRSINKGLNMFNTKSKENGSTCWLMP